VVSSGTSHGYDRRTPAVALAEQPRRDDGGTPQDDRGGEEREEPEAGHEGRAEGEQQGGAPGGPPASVAVGIDEAERGVRGPRQQRRDGDGAEAPLRPRTRRHGDEGIGERAPHDQPAGQPDRVDEVADHLEQAPRTPRRERHRQQHEGGDDGAGVADQHPGGDGERQDVGRGGHVGAGAQWQRGGGVQRPPVADRRRHWGERSAHDRAERLACGQQGEDAEQHEDDRDGTGEEARHEPAVGEVGLLVVLRR
jgi:hypothetical protein